MIKSCHVITDEFTREVSRAFDYTFTGESTFHGYDMPNIPEKFDIGVIVGASGSGKSTLLSEFGNGSLHQWANDKAIISHFISPEDGIDKLSAVGLNSIPSWCKPYHVLSTGEKFRADLARSIHDNATIDEFTSVVDRNVAKAASVSLSKYIRQKGIHNVVIATCHRDILEWIEPDWIFDTDSGELLVGRFLRRPEIKIDIFRCDKSLWKVFGKHHYLSGKLNSASRCFAGLYNGCAIAFSSAITYPSGTVKNAWREHRTVVLPDFQGMGIGTRFSDAVAQMFVNDGKRFFSRTAHIRMGEYRNKSSLWRPTSMNMKVRKDKNIDGAKNSIEWYHDLRVTYSHEYIGTLNENVIHLEFSDNISQLSFDDIMQVS